MDKEQVKAIVKEAMEQLHEERKSFWVEPEKHYNDHKSLDGILVAYQDATNIFWKTFWGLVVFGILIFAGAGMAVDNIKRLIFGK